MLYSSSLLGSLHHECAICNARQTETPGDDNVCSKPLARTIRTSMLNLVNIALAIIVRLLALDVCS